MEPVPLPQSSPGLKPAVRHQRRRWAAPARGTPPWSSAPLTISSHPSTSEYYILVIYHYTTRERKSASSFTYISAIPSKRTFMKTVNVRTKKGTENRDFIRMFSLNK